METPEPAGDYGTQPTSQTAPRRRVWLRLAVAGAAITLLYSAFWLTVANRALDSLESWAERQQQAGYQVRWRSVEMSGYPFRLVAVLEQPRIAGPAINGSGIWAWAKDTMTLSGRPWFWNALRLVAPGLHTLTVSDANGATAERVFTLDAGALSINAEFGNGAWRQIDAEGRDMRFAEGSRGIADLARFSSTLARHDLVAADEQTRTARLRIEIDTADISTLGGQQVQAIGAVIRFALLDVEVYGPLPGDLTQTALTGWRDSGGVVEVRRLRADYGPLGLDADGTLALDGQLQPVGAFVARLEGFSETVDALHGASIISDGNALTAKLVLGVMADKDGAGGRKRLSIPVNLQDRTLYAGPLAMVKLPMIRW